MISVGTCPRCGAVVVNGQHAGKAGDWICHFPSEDGRPLPSDTWIEVVLRDQPGTSCNCAGNLDNWRWRETGPGSILAYRVIHR